MKSFLHHVVALHHDESGQDLIEYALVAALIAFAAIFGMNYVALELNTAFSKIGNKLVSAIP
jgi:pilus assembly protein Flp/PilA